MMGIPKHFRQLTVATLFATVGFSGPGLAEDRAAELLERLQAATPEEAARLDADIRRHWSRSGSASMDLLFKRGNDALEDADVAAAIDHFTALTDHAPEFAEGWHGLARAYFAAELYGPAVEALGRAITLNPDQYNAVFGLGVMMQQLGDNEGAAEAFRAVLDLHPHHEEAKQALDALKREGIGREL